MAVNKEWHLTAQHIFSVPTITRLVQLNGFPGQGGTCDNRYGQQLTKECSYCDSLSSGY